MKESTVDRIRSTIAGLCAGDAISWPSWWHRLHQLPPRRAVRLSEAHDHARTWRSSSVPTPYLHATAPSTIDPGGPTDDAEWFVVAVRHHLRQLLDGSAAPDGEGAWDQLAALRAADPDAVRGRIGVIASLGNLTAGLAPPASGHDNVHWFDDLACVRGVAAGLLRPGQADLAADLAEEDACITHALDGVWGARATAALVSCLVAGESRDAAIAAARAQLPQDSWIAAVVDECRAAIGGPGDTLARAARLERDVVDHVYAYANQAPETLGLLLAHLAVTESREGLLLAALGHPRHADALVPLAAAVAGAAFGSTGGGEPLPTLTGAIIPALAGTEMDTIVDLVQAAAAPTAGGST